MKRIELNCDFIHGYIKDAHYELKLSDREYNEFLWVCLKKNKLNGLKKVILL